MFGGLSKFDIAAGHNFQRLEKQFTPNSGFPARAARLSHVSDRDVRGRGMVGRFGHRSVAFGSDKRLRLNRAAVAISDRSAVRGLFVRLDPAIDVRGVEVPGAANAHHWQFTAMC
jgi:hypothetical protein